MDTYQNMPQDTLRWLVVAHTAVKEAPKAVMRERIRRRVREAFREALKLMGYDSNGRVLQGYQGVPKPPRDLRGTLEILCRSRAALDCEFAVIIEQAKMVVCTIIESYSKSNARSNTAWLEER